MKVVIRFHLKQQGPFDGVYLALHGAMAVTDVPRPEAEIASYIDTFRNIRNYVITIRIS